MSVSSVSGHHATPPSPPRHEEQKEVQRAERDTKAEHKNDEPAKAPPASQTVGRQVNTSA